MVILRKSRKTLNGSDLDQNEPFFCEELISSYITSDRTCCMVLATSCLMHSPTELLAQKSVSGPFFRRIASRLELLQSG